jgi:hypothetical protein
VSASHLCRRSDWFASHAFPPCYPVSLDRASLERIDRLRSTDKNAIRPFHDDKSQFVEAYNKHDAAGRRSAIAARPMHPQRTIAVDLRSVGLSRASGPQLGRFGGRARQKVPRENFSLKLGAPK